MDGGLKKWISYRMFETKIIVHYNIQDTELKDICKIKSAFGDFTQESQLRWIENNLRDNDIHFLVYRNQHLIGYANLVNEDLTINNKKLNILGIGNVCTREMGKSFGSILMKEVNLYLELNKKIGLLFCKEKLSDFYKKYDWKILKPDFSDGVKWMIYNCDLVEISSINYKGKLF